MLNFLKRNVKFVIIIGVSALVVAGLSTALLVTNVASASDRGRDRDPGRDRGSVRMELTEEQVAERIEHMRERLAQRLADGRITQEEYDERIAAIESGEFPVSGRRSRGSGEGRVRGERTELTEEQKAERIAQMREKLDQRLADGSITQEQYDEKTAALDSGEYPISGRNKRGGGSKGNKAETPAEAN